LKNSKKKIDKSNQVCYLLYFLHRNLDDFAFDALTLFVGRQEEHLACKKIE